MVSLRGSSEILFTDAAADDSPQKLSGLTYIESTSPPDADGPHYFKWRKVLT